MKGFFTIRTSTGVLIALLMGGVAAQALRAQSVSGTVVIKKKLTRSRVTAAVPLYQRGTTVELTADPDEDPVAAERNRVVVYVEGPGPATAVVAKMEQLNRRFAQETVVVPVGSKVSFPNLDPIFHNVFSLSKPKIFDLGNYPKGETRTVVFTQPGIVYVNCHLHTNMTGVIVVTPNDWYAKVDKVGHFVLPDLPPGKYTIVAWHKTAGYFRKTIDLAAGENPSLEFLIPVDVDGSRLVSKLEAAKQ